MQTNLNYNLAKAKKAESKNVYYIVAISIIIYIQKKNTNKQKTDKWEINLKQSFKKIFEKKEKKTNTKAQANLKNLFKKITKSVLIFGWWIGGKLDWIWKA